MTNSRLIFQQAGDEICQYFGRSLTGSDYMDSVAPSMRQAASDTTTNILKQPCGLWQVTAVRTSEGQSTSLEYTIFPMRGLDGLCRQMIAYVRSESREHGEKLPAAIVAAQQTLAWEWIDLGHGVPAVGAAT